MSSAYILQNEMHLPSMFDPDNRDPMKINKHLQVYHFNKTNCMFVFIISIFF